MGTLSDWLRSAGQVLHLASGSDSSRYFTSAIIAAGGSSLRLGGDTTKQMTLLCGKPVVVHTLLAFENCPRISEIIVAAREDECPRYEAFRETYGLTKLTAVVPGGATRQESVLAAFNHTSPKTDFVAIHDAARCLITEEDIEAVLDAAIRYEAATAATPVTDTVKIVDRDGFITETVDRDTVRLAATPQIFRRNLYCAAAYTAKEAGFTASDDNALVERIQHRVRAVQTSRDNLKITTKEDVSRAERLLREREAAKTQEADDVSDRTGI